MYGLILVSATLICFIISSIMDFRKREVEDYISGFLVIFAVLVRTHWFLQTKNLVAIYPMIIITPITFGISYFLYKKSMWGGGDVKLISATSVAITGFKNTIFFDKFIINLLFSGAIYGIAYSIILILKNRKKIDNKSKNQIKIYSLISFITIIIISNVYPYLKKPLNQFAFFGILFAFIGLGYPFAKTAEEKLFYKKIKVDEMSEGEWLAEDIKKYNKILIKAKTTLEKKHIKLLKELKIKEILIKEGIPFIPSFLISFIITLFFPNLFLGLMGF